MEQHKSPFTVFEGNRRNLLPVIVSVPHAGTWFPKEDRWMIKEDICQHPPDTDWFVDQLFDFAPKLGISMIVANISRYIIDLNRPTAGETLYHDGRSNSGLIPEESFAGEKIYTTPVDAKSLKTKRLSLYYETYYERLEGLIKQTIERFGVCLLVDAHSIKRHVPAIRQEAFPDIIIGTNNGSSCHSRIAETAIQVLKPHYSVSLNDPFQGGQITRHFGRPEESCHALQIEMSQDLYLDESTDQLLVGHQVYKDRLQNWLTELASSLGKLG